MNTKKHIFGIAKKVGYRSRSNYLWTTGVDLVGVFYIQKSRWSNSFYVEGGLVEAAFMHHEYPPPQGHWGLSRRFSDVRSEHQKMFTQIELNEPPYDNIMFDAAIMWSMEFIRSLANDPDRVKATVLGRQVPEYDGFWRDACEGSHIIDWASGRLGPPSKYFPVLPAYFVNEQESSDRT